MTKLSFNISGIIIIEFKQSIIYNTLTLYKSKILKCYHQICQQRGR